MRSGRPPVDARRTALRTSRTVAFSGVTVILSLAGLWLVDSTTIRSMAMGAIIVVAVSILAAVTLLPVLMRLFGRRVYERGRIARALAHFTTLQRRRRRRSSYARRGGRAGLLGALDAAGDTAALGLGTRERRRADRAGAARAHARLRERRAAPVPRGNDTRVGAELAASELGPGATGPTQVIAELDAGSATDADNRAQRWAPTPPSCAAIPRSRASRRRAPRPTGARRSSLWCRGTIPRATA